MAIEGYALAAGFAITAPLARGGGAVARDSPLELTPPFLQLALTFVDVSHPTNGTEVHR